MARPQSQVQEHFQNITLQTVLDEKLACGATKPVVCLDHNMTVAQGLKASSEYTADMDCQVDTCTAPFPGTQFHQLAARVLRVVCACCQSAF